MTKNFKLSEFTRSTYAEKHGIDNTPDADQLEALTYVAEQMQRLRDAMGFAIRITSGLRKWTYSGGSNTSQHNKGEAVDFICIDNARAFAWIKQNLPYDQLIWEFGNENQPDWVHVSFSRERARKRALVAYGSRSKPKYKRFF